MVYTSTSLALAAVELFVHVERDERPDSLMRIEADLPDEVLSVEEQKVWTELNLPPNWHLSEPPITRAFGDEWMASKRSLTLLVPSVVIEGEWNVLFNPQNPDADRLIRRSVKPFSFDQRMFKE